MSKLSWINIGKGSIGACLWAGVMVNQAHAQAAPSNPAIATSVTALQTSVTNLQMALQTGVSSLQGSVNSLQSSVNALQTNLTVLQTVVGNLGNEVGKRELYNKTVRVTFPNGTGECNHSDLIVVPAGKRLVIEHVSGMAFLKQPSVFVVAQLRAMNAPQFTYLAEFPAGEPRVMPTSADTFNASAFGQSTRLMTDSNLQVCGLTSTPSTWYFNMNVSGYLVNR